MRTTQFLLPLVSTALLSAATLASCVVGDPNDNSGGADGGPAGNDAQDPDAPPQAVPAWTEVTGNAPGMRAEIHVISSTDAYAIVGNQINHWDGSTWSQHTAVQPGLGNTMHFVSPEAIYAPVGNVIQKWTGLLEAKGAWAPMSLPDPVIVVAADGPTQGDAAFHYVSDELMYAVVTPGIELPRIRKCVGTPPCVWEPLTDPIEGLSEFHFESETEIYAVTGEKVSVWAPPLVGELPVWADATPIQVGLRPALHFVAPSDIYAVVGNQVCLSTGGAAFEILTDEIEELLPVIEFVSPDDIHTAAGQSIHQWAPVLPEN